MSNHSGEDDALQPGPAPFTLAYYAQETPEKRALADDHRRYTFREFYLLANRFANVLAGIKGDALDGRVMFNTKGTCAKCHVVNGMGKEVGPNLSEIGKKLSREALFESILYPSAGISHNYESYTIILASGNVVNGLLVNKTDDAITIKDAEAIARTFKMDDVEEVIQQKVSLMPADLQKVLTQEELVNIVEYLTTLKQAEPIKKASR